MCPQTLSVTAKEEAFELVTRLVLFTSEDGGDIRRRNTKVDHVSKCSYLFVSVSLSSTVRASFSEK